MTLITGYSKNVERQLNNAIEDNNKLWKLVSDADPEIARLVRDVGCDLRFARNNFVHLSRDIKRIDAAIANLIEEYSG